MEHATIFNHSGWERARVGLPRTLLDQIRFQALELANELPPRPRPQDLLSMETELRSLRILLRTATARSEEPSFWPNPNASPEELGIWTLGLAHHLSR